MSPVVNSASAYTPSFPRVSGDEPACTDVDKLRTWFSPRERG